MPTDQQKHLHWLAERFHSALGALLSTQGNFNCSTSLKSLPLELECFDKTKNYKVKDGNHFTKEALLRELTAILVAVYSDNVIVVTIHNEFQLKVIALTTEHLGLL